MSRVEHFTRTAELILDDLNPNPKEHTMTGPMPVFTIKAKDRLAGRAIRAYIVAREDEGLDWQAEQVREALTEIEDWQRRNPEAMKLPDHQHVPVRAA